MAKQADVALQDIYKKYMMSDAGGDKGTAHSYIDIYAEMLDPSKSLLEIGVFMGHSLAMFQEYFQGEVLGLEIRDKLVVFDVPYVVCDATKADQVGETLAGKQFDYIIDDGSHSLKDQLASLKILWNYLKPGGIYFIEDIRDFGAVKSLLEAGIILWPEQVWFWDLRRKKNRSDDLLLAFRKVN